MRTVVLWVTAATLVLFAGAPAGATDVRYHRVPGADHLTLLPAIAADVVRWIGEFGTA